MLSTILTLITLVAGNPTTGVPFPPAGKAVTPPRLLAIRLATAQATPQPDDDGDVVVRRLYDLRDLATTLPAENSVQLVADTIFAELINVPYVTLAEGVYMVDALPGEHRDAAAAIETLRSLNTEGYVVRVQLVQADLSHEIRVGDTLPEEEGISTVGVIEQFVRRRATLQIAATNRSDYIADWSPVVSDNAVGYDPEFKTLEDGLSGTLLVGAGDDDDQGGARAVRVQLIGELRSADLVESTVQAPGAGVVSELPIYMARVASRGLDLRASVSLGRPTVIGVLQGFEPGSQIAVVVRVGAAE